METGERYRVRRPGVPHRNRRKPRVYEPPKRAKASRDASRAGKARAASLTPERRSEIASAGGRAKAATAANG